MTPMAPEKSAVYERSRLSMNWFLIFDFYGFFLIAVTRAGGDPRAIQDRLGHRVLSQHTERYTELAPMQFKDIRRGKRVAGGHQGRRS